MAFTSGLSAEDFALARSAGLRPLRLVGGAAVRYIPAAFALPVTGLVDPYTLRPGQAALYSKGADFWIEARAEVLRRLREEALRCGAHVVTGVTLGSRDGTLDGQYPYYEEISATGTAMALDRPPGTAAGAGPVLTAMSVAEYATLARAGYVPAGMVMTAAGAVGRSGWDTGPGHVHATLTVQETATGATDSQDRPEYAEATRVAYAAAVAELDAAAERLGAAGVTGITIQRTVASQSYGFSVLVRASGTAITAVPAGAGEEGPLTIVPVRRLSD